MGLRIAGRGWRVALAAALMSSFVGCGGTTELKGDPTVKAEQGKTVEEATVKSRPIKGGVKPEPNQVQRKSSGPS